ncbi:malate dehydrogenase-like isoform X2 [Maniola jurtina]|uniref:malate dehydrogenase-like isoform X2 n=1 Tax=Maniola jurtina TaxID=191418 RepID=UPI001E687E44|nr:malate dehydrogenase-like isoform X2 [Maniola jurtina]
MNFQCKRILEPIKVIVINPLAPASQLIIVKIMSGVVFGNDQLIDLNLLVYSNEMKSANAFRLEIESCAFSCTNSIKVSSDFPRACDGDVFCFMTNFNNPNHFDFTKEEYSEHFEALYLILKLAKNFSWADDDKEKNFETVKKTAHFNNQEVKKDVFVKKPIFMADGLVAIDILKSMTKDMPHDILFCPTPITAIAKQVECNMINEMLVWAANDEVFHVEVEKPLVLHDVVGDESHCQSGMVGKDFFESRNFDTTQFSDSWMKKEFIEKVASSAAKNPYGCIYRAAEFSKTLRDIWLTRSSEDGTKVYTNIGVISDGSLGTIKGYPYVLPLIFDRGTWSVNNRFVEDSHLKQEIKRINKAVKNHHQQLIPYCKKFLQDQIINQGLIKGEDDSVSMF